MGTYDHPKGAIHRKVGQSTTKYGIFVVIASPHEVRNRDGETLHKSDWKRVGVHEHGGCGNKTPVE